MKSLLISIIFVYSVEYCFSQNNDDYCVLFQKTIKLYNENTLYPIEPKEFNIIQFQDDFVKSIDPNSIIFTVNDLELFSLIQQVIKDDYISSYCSVENDFINIYKKNIESTIEIFEKLKTFRLDFNKPDSIYFGYESLQHTFKLDKESRCKLYIKSIIIQDIIESTTKYDSLKQNREVLLSYIDSIKIKQINKEIELLKKLLDTPKEYQENLFNSFFNSFIIQYDPYAYLFSNDTYNKFKEQLSSYSSDFGFQLETNKQGEIIIASVIQCSSSWKIWIINLGDKVLKLEI